ncbi:hypothetical protein TRAPUB_12154 [Trametes pubescens]|uniref:Uncharacterized protein n=1 Tax=Trametes pubescens TaxID=154538 RepID=A0A1M2VUR1_TRAPU|nr:hypothetical protein TRAPUB_12154 [Trametes pubescens]
MHWRIVWDMAQKLPATATARASNIEGRHVMEIFVPQEDNPTGQYLFRRHFRPKGYRSEAGWVTMPIGKLDKTTRATLVEYCSDQDPTHVGNDQNSNCITCVVDSIRAMCISAADHKIRLATPQSEDSRSGTNGHSREFDHFITEDAERAIQMAYAHTRKNS